MPRTRVYGEVKQFLHRMFEMPYDEIENLMSTYQPLLDLLIDCENGDVPEVAIQLRLCATAKDFGIYDK